MAKVKIQGHASGTGILTVTAPNTSTDRTITLPDADVTLGAATPSITDNGNATAITIDSSENVGIGVVPESWDSDYKALQISNWSALYGKNTSKNTFLTTNVYRDSGGYKYLGTDVATNYSQASDGAHKFYVAASGSADAAITWTTAMVIDNSGRVTKPNQPIATSSWSSSVALSSVIPASSIQVNIGSHLASHGRFTAPIAGTYWYSFTAMKDDGTGNFNIRLYKNGSTAGEGLTAYTNSPVYSRATSFGYITLAANDYLEFYVASGHATVHSEYGTINFALVA